MLNLFDNEFYLLDDILERLNIEGFAIVVKEARHLTKDLLSQFYGRHHGLPWFNDFIQFMTRYYSTIDSLVCFDRFYS
jgi:nucleoside diphosphate kinase